MNLNSKRLPKQEEILSSQNKENMIAWAARVFDHDKRTFKQLMVEATNKMVPGAYMLADMYLFYKPYDLIANICKCQSSFISDDKKRIKEAFKILMDFKDSNDKHVKQLMDTAMRNIHYFERIGVDKQIDLIIMIYNNFEISLTYLYGYFKKYQPTKETYKLLEIKKDIVRKLVAIKLDYIEKENRYENLLLIKKLSHYQIIKPIDVELDEVEKNYGQDCLTALIKSPYQKQLSNYKFTKTYAQIRDGFDNPPPKELLNHIKVVLFLIKGIGTVELNQQLILYLFNCMLGINIMNFIVFQDDFVFQDLGQLDSVAEEAQEYYIFILNVAFLFIKKQEHYTIRYLEKVIEFDFQFSETVLQKVIFMLQGFIQQEINEQYQPYVEKILLKIDKQLYAMFRQVTDKGFRISQILEPQEQLNIWVSMIIREKDIKFLVQHFEEFYNVCLKIHSDDKLLADINLFDLMHVFSVSLNIQQILPLLQQHLKTNKHSVDECFYQFWTLTYKIVVEYGLYHQQNVVLYIEACMLTQRRQYNTFSTLQKFNASNQIHN